MRPYELFLPARASAPYPLVLILPVLGRILFLPDLWIEKGIARFFARNGFAAAVIRRDFFCFQPGQGIEQVGQYLAEAVKRARESLDTLLQRPDIHGGTVVSLGISFGGLINVLLAASEPRIKACVFALAGGNVPEIITTSRDPLVSAYRRDILKGLKLDSERFTKNLRASLREEPLDAAQAIPAEKTLMIISKLDRVVFPRYALALWEALHKPETIFLPVGHYFAILLIPYLQRKALEFFRKKLGV